MHDAAAKPSDPPDQHTLTYRWPAFAVCLAAGFMTLLDVTIVNVALPSIEGSLGASPAELQWILAGYTLAFGIALVPAGRLGDVYGRRTLFLIGLVAFVVTSALCGLVTSGTALAVVRVLQGLAAGILNPQVVAFIQQLFSGRERARAFGLFGATIGVSTAIGPLAGGILLAVFGEEQGWRAVFLVNVPIGIVLLPIAWRLLPRPAARTASSPRLDVVGSLLLAAAVLCLMLPFVSASEGGGTTPWWTLGIGAILAVVLVRWERRLTRRGGLPVIPGALLRVRSFAFGGAVSTLYFMGFTGIWLGLTLYLQSGLGLSPLEAGLVMTPFSIAGAFSATFGARWVQRLGRVLVVIGIAIVAVTLVVVDILVGTMDDPHLLMAAVLTIAGFGNGLVISPNQTLTLAEVPVRDAGAAGGTLQTLQRFGAAIGLAVNSGFFFATLGSSGSYADAFAVSLRVVVGGMVLALIVGLLDARRRHPSDSSQTQPAATQR